MISLCDCSNFKALRDVLRKAKQTAKVKLILCRSDYLNETDIFCGVLSRMNKLKACNIVFSSELMMNDDGFAKMVKTFSKCHSVESIDFACLGLKDLTSKSQKALIVARRRFYQVKRFSTTIVKNGNIQSENAFDFPARPIRMPRLESMGLKIGINTGWVSVKDDSEESPFMHFKFSNECKNVKEFIFKYRGVTISGEYLFGLTEIFGRMKSLRSISLEFLNCHVSDQEVMLLAIQTKKLTHITKFRLKVIQYPSVSEICVIKLTSVLSKLNNLQHFDVYLRRLSIEPEQIDELMKEIQEQMQSVKCLRYNQSLHIFK